MDFDITKYEIDDTAVLTVLNADGDAELIGQDGKSAVTIELYSVGSKEGQRALARAGRNAEANMRRVMSGRMDAKAAEKAEEEQVEKLVAFTKVINNFPVEPAVLYGNPKLGFIKRQVERFIGNDGNFTKGSSKS